jgi:sulfatase maturation enzyme AslB (radical SAM superfamily)
MSSVRLDLLPDGDFPVFRGNEDGYFLYYSPGYLAAVERSQSAQFESELFSSSDGRGEEASKLRQYGQNAQARWTSIQQSKFFPVCLTLYMNKECNLQCVYCYSNPSAQPGERLSIASIKAAGAVVAKNCCERDLPFTVVFHGGGEPTLDRDLVDQALDELERIGSEYKVPLFRYIATNGVMSKEKAAWLGKRFDLIGLSCDGPSSIQSRQRPLLGGGGSTAALEQTAEIIRGIGKPIHARVTVTPYTADRQDEIAEYICQLIRPQEIHVEPVYSSDRVGEALWQAWREKADDFVEGFVKGREAAHRHGVKWSTSGSRSKDIHGPYCNIFRDVLNLVPGGVATACFKCAGKEQVRGLSAEVGMVDHDREKFILDEPNILRLREALWFSSEECQGCMNFYHCTRSCPDSCHLDGGQDYQDWRCQIQLKLTEYDLLAFGEFLYADAARRGGAAGAPIVDLESAYYE